MREPVELFTIPFTLSTEYHGLRPSIVSSYPDDVRSHGVPHDNLFILLLKRPWKSHRRVLCLHWSTVLYGSKYASKSILLLVVNIVALLLLQWCYKFKVVWVLHNNYAHDYPHPKIDVVGQSLVRTLCDVIVAQQRETLDRITLQYPKKQVVYIPHTNFVDAYGPRVTDKQQMRLRFQFAPDDIVLLSFGSQRPYKKNECLIDAFIALGADRDPRIKLWIVGKGNPAYLEELQTRAASLDCVRIQNGFIKDEDVPSYFACADYSIFYFDDSELTSGSALLSLSYGLPCIARKIAGVEQIQDGESGYVFENSQQLVELLRALPHTTKPDSARTIASVAAHDWKTVEQKYLALYTSIV